MARLLAALLAAALPLSAIAGGDPPRAKDGYVLLQLPVGGRHPICPTNLLICPATVPICDDLKIATMVDGGTTLVILGVSPGQTLCSVMSVNKVRVVYRITVR